MGLKWGFGISNKILDRSAKLSAAETSVSPAIQDLPPMPNRLSPIPHNTLTSNEAGWSVGVLWHNFIANTHLHNKYTKNRENKVRDCSYSKWRERQSHTDNAAELNKNKVKHVKAVSEYSGFVVRKRAMTSYNEHSRLSRSSLSTKLQDTTGVSKWPERRAGRGETGANENTS